MKFHLSGASDLALSTSVGPSMCRQPVMASSLARPRAKTGPLQKRTIEYNSCSQQPNKQKE